MERSAPPRSQAEAPSRQAIRSAPGAHRGLLSDRRDLAIKPHASAAYLRGWNRLSSTRLKTFGSTGPAFAGTGDRLGRDNLDGDGSIDLVVSARNRIGATGHVTDLNAWRDCGGKGSVSVRFRWYRQQPCRGGQSNADRPSHATSPALSDRLVRRNPPLREGCGAALLAGQDERDGRAQTYLHKLMTQKVSHTGLLTLRSQFREIIVRHAC